MKALQFYKKEGGDYTVSLSNKSGLGLGILIILFSIGTISRDPKSTQFIIYGIIGLLMGLLALRTYEKKVIINPKNKTITRFFSGFLNKGTKPKQFSFSQITEIYSQECYSRSNSIYQGKTIGVKVKKKSGLIKSIRIFTKIKDHKTAEAMLNETEWIIKQADKKSRN